MFVKPINVWSDEIHSQLFAGVLKPQSGQVIKLGENGQYSVFDYIDTKAKYIRAFHGATLSDARAKYRRYKLTAARADIRAAKLKFERLSGNVIKVSIRGAAVYLSAYDIKDKGVKGALRYWIRRYNLKGDLYAPLRADYSAILRVINLIETKGA